MKLRTLKDMQKKEHFKAVMENTQKWGTIPMVNYNGSLSAEIFRNTHVDINELKEEAIKWVKEEREKYGFMGIAVNNNQLKRWMKRFNITEEDLK